MTIIHTIPAADLYVGAGNVIVYSEPNGPTGVRRMAANTRTNEEGAREVEILFYESTEGQRSSFPGAKDFWTRKFEWIPATWLIEVDGAAVKVVL